VTKRSVRYSWNSVQDFFTKRWASMSFMKIGLVTSHTLLKSVS
jgi:hypothetical protein